MNSHTIKIKKRSMVDYLFCIYLFCAVISERTVLGQGTLLLFAVSIVIMRFHSGKVSVNGYLMLELLFLIYCALQSFFGIPEMLNVANRQLQTLAICFVFDVVAYNYLCSKNDIGDAAGMIVNVFAVAVPLTILVNIRNFLAGVRGDELTGISIGGITIGAVNGVGIAWVAGIGLVLMSIWKAKNNKKLYYLYLLVFGLCVLFSGTRKAIAFIFFAIFAYRLVGDNGRNLAIKSLKTFLWVLAAATVGLLMFLYIPFLYDLVGDRLESVVTYIFTGVSDESSLSTRLRLTDLAVDAIRQRPVTGWGLDNFRYVFYNDKYYTHNNYLEIAVSGGFIGVALFFSKYVYLLVGLIKKWLMAIPQEKPKAFMMLLAFLLFAILEIWQVSYYNRKMTIIYVLFAFYQMKTRTKHKTDVIRDSAQAAHVPLKDLT